MQKMHNAAALQQRVRSGKRLIAERGQVEARVQKASRGQREQSQRDKKRIEEQHHPWGRGRGGVAYPQQHRSRIKGRRTINILLLS